MIYAFILYPAVNIRQQNTPRPIIMNNKIIPEAKGENDPCELDVVI
jgi:hypothetical protein